MEIFCCECKLYCSGEQSFIQHTNGSKHKKRIEYTQKKDSSLNETEFFCSVCDLYCSNEKCLQDHYKGKDHGKKLKIMEKIKPNYSSLPNSQSEFLRATLKEDIENSIKHEKTYEIITQKNEKNFSLEEQEEFIESYLSVKNITSESTELSQNFIKKHKSNNYLTDQLNVSEIKKENTTCNDININQKSITQFGEPQNQISNNESTLPISNNDDSDEKKVELNDENISEEINNIHEKEIKQDNMFEKNEILSPKNMSLKKSNSSLLNNLNYSKNDKYIINKINEIMYNDQELIFINNHIRFIELILKTLSEKIIYTDEKESGKSKAFKKISRIGDFRKSIFLKTEKKTELILLTSIRPSLFFTKFVNFFIKQLEILNKEENYKIIPSSKETSLNILVKKINFLIKINFGFYTETNYDKKVLDYFEDNKRFIWFLEKIKPNENYLIVLRILKDFKFTNMAWKPLTSWVLELICERVMSNYPSETSPFEILKHILKAIASGVLLPDKEIALLDPCENEKKDALAYLKDEEKISLTESAQTYIQLITFNKLHKVLKIDYINDEIVF